MVGHKESIKEGQTFGSVLRNQILKRKIVVHHHRRMVAKALIFID